MEKIGTLIITLGLISFGGSVLLLILNLMFGIAIPFHLISVLFGIGAIILLLFMIIAGIILISNEF